MANAACMTHDDAARLLAEVEGDLAAVRSWPPTRLHKLDWERAVFNRRESLKRAVRRLAPKTAADLKALLAGV